LLEPCAATSGTHVKNGKLAYANNFIGDVVQMVESEQRIPTGHVVLSASFEREGDTMPPQGTLSLCIRDQKAGEKAILTQPGKFGLGGGWSSGAPEPSPSPTIIPASGPGHSPAVPSNAS
jgi:hypothetical protein